MSDEIRGGDSVGQASPKVPVNEGQTAAEAGPVQDSAVEVEASDTAVVAETEPAQAAEAATSATAEGGQVCDRELGQRLSGIVCAKVAVDAAAEQTVAQPMKPAARSLRDRWADVSRIRFGTESR